MPADSRHEPKEKRQQRVLDPVWRLCTAAACETLPEIPGAYRHCRRTFVLRLSFHSPLSRVILGSVTRWLLQYASHLHHITQQDIMSSSDNVAPEPATGGHDSWHSSLQVKRGVWILASAEHLC